ncbi:MAG TPA: OPT family oligopeptide transporter [Kofleriaceae bacterium]
MTENEQNKPVNHVSEPGSGDERQLTWRAVATGWVLGALLAFANIYIGLRTGWFFSMALVACLMSFASWRALGVFGARPLSLLENNCAQSTASSAAYATGNMIVGVAPALILLGARAPATSIAVWIACASALGVAIAIPLRRQLIEREQLPYPSGAAAAVMLQQLHRAGTHVGAAADVVRARTTWLLGGIATGAIVPVLRDALEIIPSRLRAFDWLPDFTMALEPRKMSKLGVVVEPSLLLVAAGVFVGIRTATWLLVGALITTFGLARSAMSQGALLDPANAWVEVGLWIGAPMLVGYSLVALFAQRGAFSRAFAALRTAQGPDAAPAGNPFAGPRLLAIFGVLAVVIIVLGRALFGIPVVLGCLAVPLSVAFSIVASRVQGESDITPGGPIAKLSQLAFGAASPSPSVNLPIAALAHASSTAASDLLNDLKAGHILEANVRKQIIAQALGIIAGTVASVAAYQLLLPDASPMLGEHPTFAAPAAHQFKAVAEILTNGIGSLHPFQQHLVWIGGGFGVVLAALERRASASVRSWLPSTVGLGLGMLLPFSTSLAMFIGAVAAAIATRNDRDATSGVGANRVLPLAAGVLAGESLAGVVVALIHAL